MEWNKQLIEMFKIRSRPIVARFYIGYCQNYDFCEPQLFCIDRKYCTKSITRIETKGGAILRLPEAMINHPGVHLTLRVHLRSISPIYYLNLPTLSTYNQKEL